MTADDGLFSGVKKFVLHNHWGILTKVLQTLHEEDPKTCEKWASYDPFKEPLCQKGFYRYIIS